MNILIKKLDENLELTNLEIKDGLIKMYVKSNKKTQICSECGHETRNVNTSYNRTPQDLPIQDFKVRLNIRTRVFVCNNPNCKVDRFAEQFEFLDRYKRNTKRLDKQVIEIGKNMSAVSAAKTISMCIANISHDTVISRIKSTVPISDNDEIVAICIDDFALRKNYNYATVVIDNKTRKIIEIIGSRKAEDVSEALKKYPNLTEISRDGGSMYKSASTQAHPDATQVSDRFHIIKTLNEDATSVLKSILHNIVVVGEDKEKFEKSLEKLDLPDGSTKAKHTKQEENRKQKIDLILKVKARYAEVYNYAQVARECGISAKTVKKYVICEKPEDCLYKAQSKAKPSILDKFKNMIITLDARGVKANRIYKELQKSGYEGSLSNLQEFLKKLHKEQKVLKDAEYLRRSEIVKAIYIGLDKVIGDDKHKEELFKKLFESYPTVKDLFNLITEFKEIMFIDKNPAKLDNWLVKAKVLNNDSINKFVNGIEKDLLAVKNGIELTCNNALAEGTVNKIKVIKRIMYGRASLELLTKKALLLN